MMELYFLEYVYQGLFNMATKAITYNIFIYLENVEDKCDVTYKK